MLSRFLSLRYLAAGGASRIVATMKATPALNLLLHKEYGNHKKQFTKINQGKRPREEDPSERSSPPSKRKKRAKIENVIDVVSLTKRKVAVLLAGCGAMDGTDVVEAITLAVNLDRYPYISVDYYALDKDLENCWDHQHWTPMDRRANVRTEAGRLLRTAHINELNELEQLGKTYDGLIIPGGRGVGWNLMTLAARRDPTQLNQWLRATIMNLVERRRPICCSSEGGILAALLLKGVKITFGTENGDPGDNQTAWRNQLIAEARSLNATHEDKPNYGNAYCRRYHVYSVPGRLGVRPDFNDRHRSTGILVGCLRNHWITIPEV